MNKKYTFSLVRKMVLGMILVSTITYGTSAFFIYYLSHFFTKYLSEDLYVGIVLLLGITWSSILGYFAAKFIVKTIRSLEHAVTIAAEGQLDIEIEHPKANDEFKTLSESFQKMINSLRAIVINIQNYSLGTKDRVENLSLITTDASEQAKIIRDTIDDIIAGSEQQSINSQSTYDSVQEAMKRVETIEEHTLQSKQLSEEMVSALNESEQAILSLVTGLQNISTNNHASVQKVKNLEIHAKEIIEISNVVGNFADQTHLLSLNASIEAARAGEHGRGFAVVASEIQQLANESSSSVKKINDIISEIKTTINDVVNYMKEQVQLADSESSKGEMTNKVLAEMKKTIFEVASEIDFIYKDAEAQRQQMKKTIDQAQNVAAIAEETTAGAQQVGASIQQQTVNMEDIAKVAEDLSSQSEALLAQVNTIKV